MLKETTQGDALDAIETASEDELRSVQLQRLKWSLQHAYDNVAHYKASFDAAGVHPDDLKQLSDLSKFPFTSKQDLRDNYPFGLFAVPRRRYRAFTRRAERRASPLSLATPRRTSIRGPTWSPVRSAPRVAAQATCCTMPLAMDYLRADWAFITVRSGSAAPSCRCPADRPKSRCN